MKELFGIMWASWHYIWYFPIVIIFSGIIGYWIYRKRYVAHALAHTFFRSKLLSYFSLNKVITKGILAIIGMIFLFLGVLQPQWHEKEEIVAQKGRDVLIALDVSRSMLAQDLRPSRLEWAKRKIQQLCTALASDRVGLLLFAGSAFLQCPLTKDERAFSLFLRQVDSETISSSTTRIEEVLKKAIQIFVSMPPKKSKLLIIFTDGEDFSTNLSQLRTQAAEMGLHIFTIGIGTREGAPIPILDSSGNYIEYEKNSDGSVVISHLNEGILYALAQEAGGMYISTTEHDGDIGQIVQEVNRFEKEQFDDTTIVSKEEQYPIFVGISLVCFLCEWLL